MANNEDVARLRQGVEAWNDWRRNNPEYRVDLMGAKLFMWNLANANLAEANLAGADLSRANLDARRG